MRRFLALAFACSLSIVAIGSPEPDRQTPDQFEAVHQVSQDTVKEVLFSISCQELNPEISSEMVYGDLNLCNELIGNLQNHFHGFSKLPYLVLDEDTDHKPKDRYRYPIWEYLPSLEPPIHLVS